MMVSITSVPYMVHRIVSLAVADKIFIDYDLQSIQLNCTDSSLKFLWSLKIQEIHKFSPLKFCTTFTTILLVHFHFIHWTSIYNDLAIYA